MLYCCLAYSSWPIVRPFKGASRVLQGQYHAMLKNICRVLFGQNMILGKQDSVLVSMELLKGSWDIVSKVISTPIGVISTYNYSYLTYNPTYDVP